MGLVISSMSMSLDGFVTAPGESPQHPVGVDFEVLHEWIFDGKTPADAEVLDELVSGAGAIIMGRRSFDDCAGGVWGDEGPLGMTPCFVLSHRRRPDHASDVFTFVADGIQSAVAQAQRIAGDKTVHLHGATAMQQCLAAGLLDEVQIHLVPVVFGGGIRLFDHLPEQTVRLERARVIETPHATHLRFRVHKG
jgi:dihydrofolate reductase